jgi:hypothetical protein
MRVRDELGEVFAGGFVAEVEATMAHAVSSLVAASANPVILVIGTRRRMVYGVRHW